MNRFTLVSAAALIAMSAGAAFAQSSSSSMTPDANRSSANAAALNNGLNNATPSAQPDVQNMGNGLNSNGSGGTPTGNNRANMTNNGMSQQLNASNANPSNSGDTSTGNAKMGTASKGTAMDHGDASMSSKSAMGSKSRTPRRLAESTPTEKRMTTALNMLEANGYDHFSDFRSNGQGFQANVTDINGKSGIVNIDPDNGSVSQPQ